MCVSRDVFQRGLFYMYCFVSERFFALEIDPAMSCGCGVTVIKGWGRWRGGGGVFMVGGVSAKLQRSCLGLWNARHLDGYFYVSCVDVVTLSCV